MLGETESRFGPQYVHGARGISQARARVSRTMQGRRSRGSTVRSTPGSEGIRSHTAPTSNARPAEDRAHGRGAWQVRGVGLGMTRAFVLGNAETQRRSDAACRGRGGRTRFRFSPCGGGPARSGHQPPCRSPLHRKSSSQSASLRLCVAAFQRRSRTGVYGVGTSDQPAPTAPEKGFSRNARVWSYATGFEDSRGSRRCSRRLAPGSPG